MSDYCAAFICVGGALAFEDVEDLIDAINDDGARLEADDQAFIPTSAEELRVVLHQGHLKLHDREANHGEFRHIESFCFVHGLSFDRHAGTGGYDAANTRYRPEAPIQVILTTLEGIEVVPHEPMRRAYQALLQGNVHFALTLLADNTFAELPPLPPFVIEGPV